MIWHRRSPTESDLMTILRISMTMFKAKQDPEELLALIMNMNLRKFRTVLEIGTAGGGSLFLWSALGDYNAKLISVDVDTSEYSSYVMSVFLRDLQSLYAIKGDSLVDDTYDEVVEALDGDGVDVLYIDGNHHYDCVHSDFHMYKDLVAPGGIIVLHDIGITRGPEMQVEPFWNEIRDQYRHDEFINPDPDNRCGLGILYVD